MDYKKLANLLYPNIDKDIDFYLKKFPKRNLPAGAEVTRIAPSPTGFLHLGTAYGATIDFLAAKKSNGVFYMRLEDTDQKREVEKAGEIAFDMLCYLGLTPDEGYQGSSAQKGEYGDYVQSKRTEIYHTFAKHLVANGKAFPCFCEKSESKADILERRNEMLEQTDDIEAKDPCRNLTYEQIEANIKAGKPFALRLLSSGDAEKTFEFTDLIKGKRTIRENTKDIVLIKSNGIPVYAMAHLVDDTLMGTTIVVRGEEWYPSLAAHLELFDACGLAHLKYAHTPVICKLDESGNKRKLSKRKDPEADVRYYVEKGYPKQAVVEYLINLLNSDFEAWRAKNPTANYLDFDFKISKISSNNPMFDIVKMEDVSKNVISRMTAEDVYNSVLHYSEEFDKNFAEIWKKHKQVALAVLSIGRDVERPRKDLTTFADAKTQYAYMFKELLNMKSLLNFDEKFDKETIKTFLSKYAKKMDLNLDNSEWFAQVKELAGECGFATDNKLYKANPEAFKGNVADACSLVRVATTGTNQTPDLCTILKILGKEEVERRLEFVLENL